MSYSDLGPDYYINRERAKASLPSIEEEATNLGLHGPTEYGMLFADPDWKADPRRVLKLDLSTHEGRVEASKQLFALPASMNPWSDFVIVKHEPDPEPTYPVYDSESSKWVDVPFHVAWLFYGLFVFMGQLLVFGFSTMLFHWPLGVYVMWGCLDLFSLPFLSYWWTKHARYRHYKN